MRKGYEIGTAAGATRAQQALERLAFFEGDSHASAWVKGLIYGDGSVHGGGKTYRVLFFGNEDTVDKFRALMRADRKKKKSNGFETYFDSKMIVQWFRDRGVRTKKSHTLQWPDIDPKFKWDFIRGLVDTDGMLAFDDPKARGARGRIKLVLGFSSATRDFCQRFAHEVGRPNAGVCLTTKDMNGKTYTCYAVKFGFEDSLKILRQVYAAPCAIRNEERYQRYLRAEALWAEYNSGCHVIVDPGTGKVCGKAIHTGDVCTAHMWEAKTAGRICEGCGKDECDRGWFCNACFYRSYRLLKNPHLKTRKRRNS